MEKDDDAVWVPFKIVNHPKLSEKAKILWVEINHNHSDEIGGCSKPDYALMKFIDVKLSQFQEVLKELRDAGLVVGINRGRVGRVLKAIDPDEAVPANKKNLVQTT